MIKWHNEKKKISELNPAVYNPRQLTEKQKQDLDTSLERFSLADPIVINLNNNIIGGHQRIKILKERGIDEVDVRIPNIELSPDQEKELNLRLNRNLGEWNWELLGKFNEDMLKDVGFNSQELDKVFRSDDLTDIDDIPDVRQTSIQLGEIYKLGEHRVMVGDSTERRHVEALMGDFKADMVFTDPPYNVNYQGGMNAFSQNKRKGIENDKMDDESFYQLLKNFLTLSMEFCEGSYYICMGNSQIHTLRKAFEEADGHWQNYIIWVKNHFTITRGDYQHQYEPILYGWNKSIKKHYFVGVHNLSNVWEDLREVKTDFNGEYTSIKFQGFEVKIKGKVKGSVRKKQIETNIWRYDKPSRSEEHPTMKPVELIERAIENSSHRETIIYDPFGGSGSTLIACERTNRKCFTMEIDPPYCQVIIDRWEKLTGQKAVKEVN